MRLKPLAFAFVSAAVAMMPAERAQANDALGGFIAGAILGGVIGAQQRQQQQQQQQRRPSNPGISQAQREENRQVQSALNYFNWNVGTVDGSLGPRSRSAISQYQAAMGFPADGQMDDFERGFLLNSHQRAMASMGVPPYNQIFAQQGPQGLLRTFRNEQLGIPTPGLQNAAAPVQQAPQPTITQTPPQAPAGQVVAPGLPVFPTATPVRSMSSHCNSVSVLTASNNGLATAANMTDANLALNEQFCLARTYAVSEANRMLGAMPGVSPEQVEQQCAGLAAFLETVTSSADGKTPAQVRQNAAAVLAGAGQTQDQLISTGMVCLGTGYRVDDADVAFASAVMLAASGRPAFGELVGHHLREGFGTGANPAKGAEWMTEAVATLESGGVPAVLPGSTADRVAVLRAALRGGAGAAPGVPVFPTIGGN